MTAENRERGMQRASGMSQRRVRWLAALGGLIGAAVVLAVAEVVSLVVGSAGSPLFAVGSVVVDLAPAGVKEFMIALFGTGDKAALLVLMAVIIVLFAGIAGLVEFRRSPYGVIIFGVFGLLALIAVLTRAGSTGIDGVPTILGAVVGVVVLRILEGRLHRWQEATIETAAIRAASGRRGSAGPSGSTEPAGPAGSANSPVESSGPPLGTPTAAPAPKPELSTSLLDAASSARRIVELKVERRRFLSLAVASGALALVVGAVARSVNAGQSAVVAIRTKIRLPAAAVTAPAVPASAMLEIAGLSSFITPNADFYRIDTAFQVPSIVPANWTLKISGMVEKEISLTFAELLAKPLEEHIITLTCVSDDLGGDLIGNALWLGYPIRQLLLDAVPTAGADMVLSTSIDGFTAGTPLSVLQDTNTNALLAVGMNGATLPLEHGFPVRMVVPGLYGYVSATKWVVEMKVTKFADAEGYWTPRGWDALGPIKLASRIDTPVSGASLAAGTIPIAGVAWEQHVGVKSVEVQIDNGAWVQATLADSISADTWRQWVYRWPATKGSHKIQVRATDANGKTQNSAYRPPAPNGSEGWDAVSVTVN